MTIFQLFPHTLSFNVFNIKISPQVIFVFFFYYICPLLQKLISVSESFAFSFFPFPSFLSLPFLFLSHSVSFSLSLHTNTHTQIGRNSKWPGFHFVAQRGVFLCLAGMIARMMLIWAESCRMVSVVLTPSFPRAGVCSLALRCAGGPWL